MRSLSVTYLDLFLSVTDGILSTKLYDKIYAFDFRIVNLPYVAIYQSLQLMLFMSRKLSDTQALALRMVIEKLKI